MTEPTREQLIEKYKTWFEEISTSELVKLATAALKHPRLAASVLNGDDRFTAWVEALEAVLEARDGPNLSVH